MSSRERSIPNKRIPPYKYLSVINISSPNYAISLGAVKAPLISHHSGRLTRLKSHPARPEGEATDGDGPQRLLPETELTMQGELSAFQLKLHLFWKRHKR